MSIFFPFLLFFYLCDETKELTEIKYKRGNYTHKVLEIENETGVRPRLES